MICLENEFVLCFSNDLYNNNNSFLPHQQNVFITWKSRKNVCFWCNLLPPPLEFKWLFPKRPVQIWAICMYYLSLYTSIRSMPKLWGFWHRQNSRGTLFDPRIWNLLHSHCSITSFNKLCQNSPGSIRSCQNPHSVRIVIDRISRVCWPHSCPNWNINMTGLLLFLTLRTTSILRPNHLMPMFMLNIYLSNWPVKCASDMLCAWPMSGKKSCNMPLVLITYRCSVLWKV